MVGENNVEEERRPDEMDKMPDGSIIEIRYVVFNSPDIPIKKLFIVV
jgi:hypothetical protein